jgi:hypothetical protein
VLKDGKIAVNAEIEVAWINEAFEKLNNELFKLPLHLYANGKMAELIKKFLNKGILVESDMFKTDTMLLNKIRTSYEGYEAIKAIKQLKGFNEFMRHGAVPKIKKRTLNALIGVVAGGWLLCSGHNGELGIRANIDAYRSRSG